MARLAFLQFYPNDWLAEPSVRACSLAARGLWIDMLSLMHLSPRRGYLLSASGSPLTPEHLARMTGCTAEEATRLIAELRSSGCFNCTDDGVIYSRRMVRDEQKRERCREAGRRGGGNPNLRKPLVSEPTFKGGSKGGSKGGVKPQRPETRDQREDPPNPPPGGTPKATPEAVPLPAELDQPAFREAWASWLAYRTSRRKPVSDKAARMQLAKLAPVGPVAAVACIEASIANDYQGLFPEKYTAGAAGRAPPHLDHAAKQELRIMSQIAEGLRGA
jgi:hypothetical protein